MISPQFGHGNFVALVFGGIILWHDVHMGMDTVVVSLIGVAFCRFGIGCCACLYLLCFRVSRQALACVHKLLIASLLHGGLMRKELSQRLLRELLENSKRSDRELAKVLEVSQPTITRYRRQLEKAGTIQDYTIVPDFRKMGFELLALTLVKFRPEFYTPEIMEEAKKAAAEFPDAIFLSTGEGLEANFLIISLNRNFTEYHSRLNRLRLHWKDFLEGFQSFIVSIGEGEYKRFSIAHLADMPLDP